ncbi:MAG TPA: phytanoyl-CoA dioxygenase family protein, partial [Allosphingosinicella sp.]|nr:phytanoyl-CoA dioxygenase family protein [Allosphingosinicella sp.]
MTYEPGDIMGGLYGDGIIALKGAFDRGWVVQMGEDIERLFEQAKQVPHGALPRGPQRWYVEVQPERVRGFVDIATHPWFVAVCEAVLGPDYKIVEIGFDIPFPGAADQPWHRDFPAPEATMTGRRLNSLAFNLTAVDTTEEMGAFEIAPGTQWDDLSGCTNEMFPPRELWPRYEVRKVRKLAQMGDISARSALTVHRGTANRSDVARPVLVVGVDAPDATNANHHDLQVTKAYAETL